MLPRPDYALSLCSWPSVLLLAGAASLASAQELPTPAAPEPDPADDILHLDEFVVTSVAAPGSVTKMQSSVSISTLPLERIEISVPRNTPEIFRSLPAIRSEATSGDSNTNITARGLPLSTGGSQYVQLQEDGVPVLQFGDVAFATADTFLRADATLQTIEAVRGGSASTQATSAPGGVINLLSKTGEIAGGSLAYTHGLDYDTDRVDLAYGGPLTEHLRFHVGGFYRNGEGSRHTGFSGYDGGQLKLNVTRDFEGGFVRFYFKALRDQGPTYMPMPVRVTGSGANPSFSSFASYDLLEDTQYTPALTRDLHLDASGNVTSSEVTDGVLSKSTSLGAELNFTLPGGWNLSDRLQFATNSGRFIAPFPADVLDAQTLANQLGGSGATLWWATGARAGQQITDPASLNGNGLLTRMHLFNTNVESMDNVSNNLRALKTLELPADAKLTLGAGLYTARQEIKQDWLWNTYVMGVAREAELIDIRQAAPAGSPASAGTLVTERGLAAYGVPAWGWFARRYDLTYDITAPTGSVSYTSEKLSIDASVRREGVEVHGAKYNANATRPVIDVNRDGQISHPESLGAATIDLSQPGLPANYEADFLSYSVGANYSFSKELAVFARYSRGAAIRADRLLDADSLNLDGSIPSDDVGFNVTKQTEIGVKYRPAQLVPGNLAFFVTAFGAKTDEANSEAAKGGDPLILRSYDAKGVELESAYSWRGLDVRLNVTWTDAEIEGANDASVIGKTPRRQADWIYSLTPSYSTEKFNVGCSFIGTTDAYTQDSNALVMPGYFYTNLFAGYQLTKGLWLSLSVNNSFDEEGFTEAEEGSLPANGIARFRSIPGRTTSLSLRYTF